MRLKTAALALPALALLALPGCANDRDEVALATASDVQAVNQRVQTLEGQVQQAQQAASRAQQAADRATSAAERVEELFRTAQRK